MLMSIVAARQVLAKLWWIYGGMYATALSIYLCVMHRSDLFTRSVLVVFCIGIAQGGYATYRTVFDSGSAIRTIPMGVSLWYVFAGCAPALAVVIAGRSDLRWLAFCTHAACISLALLGGMYREARALELWPEASDKWKIEIEKYVNYQTRQVSTLSNNHNSNSAIKHPFWIAAIGSANIPLLFEMYGGGRVNAIFFAAPLMTLTFAYINFKNLGPALLRLLLLRKLETEVGYRFQNADYEQIQELRRGFFLAKWLMKDYRPPQPVADSSPVATAPRQEQKRKRRR